MPEILVFTAVQNTEKFGYLIKINRTDNHKTGVVICHNTRF